MHACDPPVLKEEMRDRAPLTQFCTALDGGPDKQVVQEEAVWREGVGLAIDGWRGAREGKRADIDGETAHRRALGRHDLLTQAPAGEAGDATLMHKMGGH